MEAIAGAKISEESGCQGPRVGRRRVTRGGKKKDARQRREGVHLELKNDEYRKNEVKE